ncbi:MAG: hypothetical protein EH225_02405 [Calditrichaeota bacterium]|nr:Na+/H+ antiporter subunit E [Calditrichota bacterium]RQW07087.1 MAG: hypothetical protein EH225_02405 [Calditrichota bacterium]
MKKIVKIISFVFFYIWEVILSNFRVAYDILTPRHRMNPGIIALPLEEHTDLELMAIFNLITMTPGTLSLEISPDRKFLYIHAMYVKNPDVLRNELKNKIEKRILEIFR